MLPVGSLSGDSMPQAHNITPIVTLQIWILVMATSRLVVVNSGPTRTDIQ
jgi:hypothetical protein